MNGLRAFLWSLTVGATLGTWGEMPHDLAKSARVYHADGGDEDRLMELVGCVLEEPVGGGKSMQCSEAFLWIGPRSTVRLALGDTANVQVEGYAQEARARTATVGTVGAGRVDRGVLHDGSCYGAVGECVLLQGQGWKFVVRSGRLELVDPGGRVRQAWAE